MTKRATARATPPELTITDDELVYRGPIDLGADSVAITFRAARSSRSTESLAAAFDHGDPHLANEVVRSTPLPLAVIELLARRCNEASPEASAALAAGEGAPDVRWMRALSTTFGAKKHAPQKQPPMTVVSAHDGHRVMALRAIGPRTVALSYALEYGDKPIESTLHFAASDGREPVTHTFSTMSSVQRALPLPLLAPSDALWLSKRSPDGATTLETWSLDGERLEASKTVTESPPQFVSILGSELWLHCDRHHVRVRSDGERESVEHQDPWQRPLVIGRALLSFSRRVFDQEQRTYVSREGQWIALDASRERRPFAWTFAVHRGAESEGRAFIATDGGVFVVDPFAEPKLVAGGAPCYAIASLRERVAFVLGATLHVIDSRSLATILSVAIPCPEGHTIFGLHMSEACIVATDFTRAFVVDHTGALRWSSGERREPRAVTLADGTTIVSAGELVSAIDRNGALVSTNALAYDGQLVGATRAHAIFGPVSGGVARTEPDALYAVDHRGRAVDSLSKTEIGVVRRPDRSRYGGGTESDGGAITDDRVLVVDHAGSLVEWRPIDTQERVFAEARRAPSAKGVVETRYHTSNPRDDWPEPGIDLNAVSFYAEDCTWRGTTGVSPERAVIVRNGAIATLVRCKIDGDGGGARVLQSSTLVLCDCVFDRSTIDVEPGSHLLVLNTADN